MASWDASVQHINLYNYLNVLYTYVEDRYLYLSAYQFEGAIPKLIIQALIHI